MKIISFDQEKKQEQTIKNPILFDKIINEIITLYEKSDCGCLCNNNSYNIDFNNDIKEKEDKSIKLNKIVEKSNELKKDLPQKIMNLENEISFLKNNLLEKLGAEI